MSVRLGRCLRTSSRLCLLNVVMTLTLLYVFSRQWPPRRERAPVGAPVGAPARSRAPVGAPVGAPARPRAPVGAPVGAPARPRAPVRAYAAKTFDKLRSNKGRTPDDVLSERAVNIQNFAPVEDTQIIEISGLDPHVRIFNWAGYDHKNGKITPTPSFKNCYSLRIKPQKAKICVHQDHEDLYVSRSLRLFGAWEGGTLALFMRALRGNPNLDVLDLGANLGQYSLAAAALHRRVISVEPLADNIRHFNSSVMLNGFDDRITLVTNAVSNTREKVFFKTYKENKGGTSMWEGKVACKGGQGCPYAWSILMDDLLPIALTKGITTAIMKIDIEGAEHLAFAQASALFSKIHISLIFTEMTIQRKFCGANAPESGDKRLTLNMFSFLKKQGYTRVFTLNGKSLDPNHCSETWPKDGIWVHHTQKFPL